MSFSASARPEPALSAADAVSAVAESPRHRVEGVFEFVVAGVGRDGDHWFLNSEENYRSPTCLTVSIRRSQWGSIRELAGGDPENLVGKTIRIDGVAKQVRVYFRPEVRDIEIRSYHQTHIRLREPSAIAIVEAQ